MIQRAIVWSYKMLLILHNVSERCDVSGNLITFETMVASCSRHQGMISPARLQGPYAASSWTQGCRASQNCTDVMSQCAASVGTSK